MASIIGTDGFSVEYNITDGEPREVCVSGECIYRSDMEASCMRAPYNVSIETPGWKDQLASELIRHGKHKSSPRFGGYLAVSIWAEEQGLLGLVK